MRRNSEMKAKNARHLGEKVYLQVLLFPATFSRETPHPAAKYVAVRQSRRSAQPGAGLSRWSAAPQDSRDARIPRPSAPPRQAYRGERAVATREVGSSLMIACGSEGTTVERALRRNGKNCFSTLVHCICQGCQIWMKAVYWSCNRNNHFLLIAFGFRSKRS